MNENDKNNPEDPFPRNRNPLPFLWLYFQASQDGFTSEDPDICYENLEFTEEDKEFLRSFRIQPT